VRLEEVVFLAGTELRAACWVITNRSVFPLRLTELAITRALSLMAGLADAQMALAINQLNRQAATPFSNLDILRINNFLSGFASQKGNATSISTPTTIAGSHKLRTSITILSFMASFLRSLPALVV
jgi:hypothetical protein